MTGPFTDALTGPDGTGDPVLPSVVPMVHPDPTAESSGSGRQITDSDDWSAAPVRVPVLAPVVIDPQMVARAEAELARQAERDRAERVYAQSARSDAARRSAIARSRTTQPAPPPAAPGPRTYPTALRNQPSNYPPPAPKPAGPRAPKQSKASGAWAVLVFIVIALIVSGLGGEIVDAISAFLNR